jgi:hypothetical protein
MTNQHPITPPSELVDQWTDMLSHRSDHDVFALAARWGADQELEACIELLQADGYQGKAMDLRNARRPKPPSLKEQGLESLNEVVNCLKMLVPGASVDGIDIENIRRALEALPND